MGMFQSIYDLGHGFQRSEFLPASAACTASSRDLSIRSADRNLLQLRFDPIDREGVVTLANARIVDRDGRVVRQFTSAQLQPIQQIAV